ncbi:hypothetical protein SAMN04488510_10513 [Fervidobacterium changbaicum]|uniref:DUF1659 domain-containing protein n=2 Tax=Fervidobacterium TaxID=2422 RepID=A0AAI8CMC9_FERIS|nr:MULTISPECIES: hypothetical protein [Fervidobacterium]AMW33066.1 hypothetical protein NA23_07285 [Fervidobacterium islandicum]QAV33109.1 hypothetical protein CBS1_04780 [Fervidobacterium changbaicum]SDH10475.1 hypothetical protein SAMN04488510_10513 [Fervidobacterium changbaicum]
MKRLVLRWVVGFDENNEPIYRRQSIAVSDSFNSENAQVIVSILDKYSKYMCESAQLVTTESVGDEL